MRFFNIPINNFSSVEEDKNSEFLKVTLMVISEGKNLNKTFFTLDGMERCKNSFINKPILCAFPNGKIGDNHNFDINIDPETMQDYQTFLYKDAEKPVGLIPESSNIRIENIDGKNWIVLDGYIWEKYNYELVKDIKKKKSGGWAIRDNKRISAEIYIDDDTLETMDDGETEILNNWTGSGIAILGDDIPEAISGANLREFSVSKDYKEYTRVFMNKFMQFSEKNSYGSGDAIKIDKSKEHISKTPWGDIDKTKLRNDILKASNYKTIVKDVYMKIEDGWEEAPSEKLKYPVMEIKDNTLVYNVGGLSSALGYAKTEKDSGVINKVESIRKKLGVDKELQKNNSIERRLNVNIVDIFKDNENYVFIGNMTENKALVFSKNDKLFKSISVEKSEDGKVLMAEDKAVVCSILAKENMSCDEDEEIEEEDKKEEEMACDKEMANLFEKVCSSDENKEIEEEDKKEEEMARDKEEINSLKKELSDKSKELEESKSKIEEYESKFAEEEKKEMAKELDEFAEKECMSEEEKELARSKISEFSSKEEFMKFVVFSQYEKTKNEKKPEHIIMGMHFIPQLSNDIWTELQNNLKK